MSSSSYVFCCVVRVTRMLSAMHFQPASISVDDCVVRVMDFPRSMRRGRSLSRLAAGMAGRARGRVPCARRRHGEDRRESRQRARRAANASPRAVTDAAQSIAAAAHDFRHGRSARALEPPAQPADMTVDGALQRVGIRVQPAQNRADARHDVGPVERLRDVVVGAEAQSLQAIEAMACRGHASICFASAVSCVTRRRSAALHATAQPGFVRGVGAERIM